MERPIKTINELLAQTLIYLLWFHPPPFSRSCVEWLELTIREKIHKPPSIHNSYWVLYLCALWFHQSQTNINPHRATFLRVSRLLRERLIRPTQDLTENHWTARTLEAISYCWAGLGDHTVIRDISVERLKTTQSFRVGFSCGRDGSGDASWKRWPLG